jgi:hypothetical protein
MIEEGRHAWRQRRTTDAASRKAPRSRCCWRICTCAGSCWDGKPRLSHRSRPWDLDRPKRPQEGVGNSAARFGSWVAVQQEQEKPLSGPATNRGDPYGPRALQRCTNLQRPARVALSALWPYGEPNTEGVASTRKRTALPIIRRAARRAVPSEA